MLFTDNFEVCLLTKREFSSNITHCHCLKKKILRIRIHNPFGPPGSEKRWSGRKRPKFLNFCSKDVMDLLQTSITIEAYKKGVAFVINIEYTQSIEKRENYLFNSEQIFFKSWKSSKTAPHWSGCFLSRALVGDFLNLGCSD